MVKKSELPAHVVATAMTLAATRGWRELSLGEIAEEAGLTLAQMYERFPTKASILLALAKEADANMLAVAARDPDKAEEPPRDRLFDVLMARFDVLAPHKDGIAAVLRDGAGNPFCGPIIAACWGRRLTRSMRWALEAAGIGSGGMRGTVRAKALLAVYASVVPVWLRDDSADMARTMAALDRRLAQADRLAAMCSKPSSRPEEEAPDEKPAKRGGRRKGQGRGQARAAPA